MKRGIRFGWLAGWFVRYMVGLGFVSRILLLPGSRVLTAASLLFIFCGRGCGDDYVAGLVVCCCYCYTGGLGSRLIDITKRLLLHARTHTRSLGVLN